MHDNRVNGQNRFTTVIQVSENSAIVTKHRKIYKKILPNAIEISLILTFDLNQTCKIVLAENLKLKNKMHDKWLENQS